MSVGKRSHLRRDVVGDQPEVDFLVAVETGNNPDETRARRSILVNAAQTEDDGPLVLLHNPAGMDAHM